jgi:hypothetical protein
MMEIAVAIATAGRAFNYINAAVNKGHEIQDLATKFGAFFDAKDSILEHEANINNASTVSKIFAKGSVESQALQITMAKHKAQQMESQLRELIVLTVGQQFYVEMMRQRQAIRKQRLEAARARAARKRMIIDGMGFLFISGLLLMCILAILGAVF